MPLRYLRRRADGQSRLPPVDEAATPIVPDEDFGSLHAYGILRRKAEPYSAATPGGRSLPEMPQSKELVGLVSGEPMACYSVPSPIFFPDTAAQGDEDWLVKLLAGRYRG